MIQVTEEDCRVSKAEIFTWLIVSFFLLVLSLFAVSLVSIHSVMCLASIGMYQQVDFYYDKTILYSLLFIMPVTACFAVIFAVMDKRARNIESERINPCFKRLALLFFSLFCFSFLAYGCYGLYVFSNNFSLLLIILCSLLLIVPTFIAWRKACVLAICNDEMRKEKSIEKFEFASTYSVTIISIGFAVLIGFFQLPLAQNIKDANSNKEVLYVEVLPDANHGVNSVGQSKEMRLSDLEEIGSFIVRGRFDSEETYYVVSEYDGDNKRVYVVEAPFVESAHSFFEFLPSD